MTTTEEHVVGDKYLTMRLGLEHYAVETLRVREIIGLLDITTLPQMPDYVRGVINLRGRIIPVVDLRLRLGMPPVEYGPRTCVVVLELYGEGEEEQVQIGCIVDSVNEVREINSDQVEPPSTLKNPERAMFIKGLAKIPEYKVVVSLLDIDALLSMSFLEGLNLPQGASDVA